jgi:hypothetical protein
MMRQISLILGIGAFLTIFADMAQAEPINKQNPSSRGSLNTLENRSLETDPEVFFPESSQRNTPSYPEGTIGEESRYDTEFEAFGEEFKVDVGEYLRDGDSYFNPSVAPGDVADDEKVRVLIELEEWNNRR